MSRRLLPLVAAVVVGALSAGCADDVAPAARVGDAIKISNDDLLAEADEWLRSPTLLGELQIPVTEGAGEGSYDTSFVDFLLSNRISFEVHNAQFKELGLELTDQELVELRAGLFTDPATSQAVFEELSTEYSDELVADLARRVAVSQAMGEGYQAWLLGVFTGGDIEINRRYGSLDPLSGQVVPPLGPRQAPGGDLFVER